MKPVWKDVLLALGMGLLLPAAMLHIAVRFSRPELQEQIDATEATVWIRETVPSAQQVYIDVLMDGTVMEMDLEEYLTGVVLGEMPVSFELEAQKAQAVVARTFTLKTKSGRKHDNGAVCTDSTCCQAYISPEDYLAKSGTQEGLDQIRSAVKQTAGMVLTYDGELIEATYFSCSGGSTEDAVAVWGTDVPYLRATISPGEEYATHYTDTVTFTAKEFSSALSLNGEGSVESWLGPVTYTAGGGVNTMIISGKTFKGTELRKLLGLRSTAFTITVGENSVTVTTKGYGHRVGMSQYGADAMAAGGSTYEEILAHYYQGTTLEQWSD